MAPNIRLIETYSEHLHTQQTTLGIICLPVMQTLCLVCHSKVTESFTVIFIRTIQCNGINNITETDGSRNNVADNGTDDNVDGNGTDGDITGRPHDYTDNVVGNDTDDVAGNDTEDNVAGSGTDDNRSQ